MKSTQLLTADHEVILQALNVLKAICDRMENHQPVELCEIRSLLKFLKEFTDGSHHVKEETILFPALMQAGMSMNDGPLTVMNYEHERGRALIGAMDEALGRDDKHDLVMYARRYIELMSQHIEKETYVLFDMADQKLTDEEDQKIADGFRRLENTVAGTAVVDSLAKKYIGYNSGTDV